MTIVFLMGVVVGSLSIEFVLENDKSELGEYIYVFLNEFENRMTLNNAAVVKQSLISNLKIVGLAYLLGLSVIGIPFLLIVVFLRGFVLGFTVGFLIDQLVYRGLLLALVSILPQSLIAIPVVIVSSVAATSFSIAFVKSQIMAGRDNLLHRFVSFTVIILLMALLVILASMIEAYVTPVFLRLLVKAVS